MNQPKIKYDELSDTLTVSFESGVLATGIELTEHILLRLDRQEKKAISLVFLEYSVLAQATDIGTRSFPLTGLSHLPSKIREMVFEILLNKPVSDFLRLSAYTISIVETIPIVSLQPISVA